MFDDRAGALGKKQMTERERWHFHIPVKVLNEIERLEEEIQIAMADGREVPLENKVWVLALKMFPNGRNIAEIYAKKELGKRLTETEKRTLDDLMEERAKLLGIDDANIKTRRALKLK